MRMIYSVCFAVAVATTVGLAENQTRAANAPQRVLFIGNSLTYSQGGIYTHLEKMSASMAPPVVIQADKSVFGGQYLKTLWERYPEPRQAIAKGYDVVVLQEDLPETTVADFREYSRKFVADIKKTNARPILLMAWAYQRLGWISMSEIADAHRAAAGELGVAVAPVGLAWERVAREHPELDLFVQDREHPSIYGTYLATAVVFATIFDRNPAESSYVPDGISGAVARALGQAAWETVRSSRNR